MPLICESIAGRLTPGRILREVKSMLLGPCAACYARCAHVQRSPVPPSSPQRAPKAAPAAAEPAPAAEEPAPAVEEAAPAPAAAAAAAPAKEEKAAAPKEEKKAAAAAGACRARAFCTWRVDERAASAWAAGMQGAASVLAAGTPSCAGVCQGCGLDA